MHEMRRQVVSRVMAVAVALTFGHVAGGADRPSATAPTNPAPATQPSKDVDRAKQLLARLAADDYDRREEARIALMGLRRSELPALREAVQQSLPLAPSQLSVLRDIVTHVYLTGDAYLPDENGLGFLGVTLAGPLNPEEHGMLGIERGVAVVSRAPGFAAYRLLQNGDVLLALKVGRERVEVNTTPMLQRAVMAVKAGQVVTFDVLRQGAIVTVPIKLDARPFNLSIMGFEELGARRADQAEEFWQQNFAPLIDETLI